MNVREMLRRTANALNPIYRNPIVVMPDAEHLNDGERAVLRNPQLNQRLILTHLLQQTPVNDAVRQLEGEYLLEAAVVDNHLHVNVFEVHPTAQPVTDAKVAPELLTRRKVFNPTWEADSAPRYTLYVEPKKASAKILIAPVLNAFYDPHAPCMSWVVELDSEMQRKLGLKVLAH